LGGESKRESYNLTTVETIWGELRSYVEQDMRAAQGAAP
jgi:hypothetical protein